MIQHGDLVEKKLSRNHQAMKDVHSRAGDGSDALAGNVDKGINECGRNVVCVSIVAPTALGAAATDGSTGTVAAEID